MNTYGMLIIVMTIWMIISVLLIWLGIYAAAIGFTLAIIIFSTVGYYYSETRAWLSLVGTIFIVGCVIWHIYHNERWIDFFP